ncbi:uncharacterized protein LOC112340616 [Selaginella moellendorffii]|uniref:uncharacterized protein LOC112340616 n=1 Tax=Selaginella moellendorffii TaxID=88036 RepID=UPI000D1CBC81|nr:uncharacterized protein LOC112340616 [Selaginella moellendorffii]|eukprot:XP_024515155.1 uncharacterized protein LOC112340616 [Selaginella moellendorffii]
MPASSYRQQQGVNWGLVVGGAVATVLSLAFTRSSKNKSKNKAAAAAAAIHPEQHGNGLAAMDAECMVLRRESSSGSSSSGSSSEISSDGIVHRQAVHRLRHQLKSREEMIMEMQAQLSSKEKALHSHTSLIANLERQLKEANDSIFEVERVIQELHGPKANTSTGQSSGSSGTTEVAIDMGTQCSSDSDEHQEHELEGENKLIVKNSGKNSENNEMVLHAKEGDYQLVFERAKHLEAELLGIRAMAQEMASLLEMSERERLRLHHVVSQLQQKLAFQAKELNTMRATTHFLKVSLGSRRSGDDYTDLYNKAARLSRDEDGSPLQLRSSNAQAARPTKQRYSESASVDSSLEVSEIIDPSVRDENSTSSSTGSYWSSGGRDDQELEEEQEGGRMADYRSYDSPGVVRIGSPTIVGSRSSMESGTAQRYLFSDDQELGESEELEGGEEFATAATARTTRSSLEAVVEEEEEGSSGSSSVMEEMLDETLEDLVKATTPRATTITGRRSV